MIDLVAAIADALRSPEVAKSIAEAVRPIVAEEVAKALAAVKVEPLEPLGEILGCSDDAARMREVRDPGYAPLAVVVGRRRLYRRGDVESYLRAKGRRARVRAVRGECA